MLKAQEIWIFSYLQCGHPSDLEVLRPEQIRRPDDGHVLGGHAGVVAPQGHAVEVAGEVFKGSEISTRNVSE